MAPSLADVIGQFKADVGCVLSPEIIEAVCSELGHEYRRRILDPVTTVHAFLTQVLHGNTACAELPHLLGKSFTASAYINARARLPLLLFERLSDRVSAGLESERNAANCWRGHRTWHLDGSNFSMADRPELQEAFGQPGGQRKGCGFPVAQAFFMISKVSECTRSWFPSAGAFMMIWPEGSERPSKAPGTTSSAFLVCCWNAASSALASAGDAASPAATAR